MIRRSVTLIALLVIPAALGATKIPACPSGRYLLAAGDDGLIFGDQTPTTDAVMVAATTLSTPTCGPAHAKPRGTKKGTVVRATWKKCGSFKKVVATATITDNCATMTGTIKAKKVPARVFTAHLSTGCGDHLVDKGLGEQCEGDGDCDVPGAICANCACEAPTTTTRTTSSSTTTTVAGCHPSTNESGVCGNCVIDPGEDCDDGNRVDGDACTNQCHVAQCGDGVVETGVEECDDGNYDETDGCTPLCKLARCGDGVVEKGVEDCDDGEPNGTPGDLCQADCTFSKVSCAPSGRIALVATLVPKKDHSTFSAPKGLTLSLGYPSGLSLPGSGSLPIDDPSDPAAHIVLLDPGSLQRSRRLQRLEHHPQDCRRCDGHLITLERVPLRARQLRLHTRRALQRRPVLVHRHRRVG
jgi:cysteine-rich repeat protein